MDSTILRRELPLGLSAALFFLWLPLMTPHILSALAERETLWALRGLPILFAVTAGFSAALLGERFAPKASLRLRRLWACAALMLLTPVFLYLRLPPLIGLLGLFFCAVCVAALLMPVLQALPSGEGLLRVLLWAAAVGGGLAAAGQLALDWLGGAAPFRAPAAVLMAGALLTAGMFASRRVKQRTAAAPDLCVVVERARETRLFAFRCAGLTLSCAGTLLMAADLYAARRGDLAPWYTVSPLLTLTAAGLLAAITLWGKRWLFLYATALGVLLGGLTLSAKQAGTLPVYLDMFLLSLGVAGLGVMLLESLCDMTAPVNRTLALGLGGAVCFSFIWLVADPEQLLFLGVRLKRPGADLPLIEGLFLLLPLLIGYRSAAVRAAARAEPERVSPAAEEEEQPVPQDELYKQLTATEKKVFQLILMGYANQQMADSLYVSINTIKFHVKNILAKAGVTKKSQLMGLHVHMVSADSAERADSEKLS